MKCTQENGKKLEAIRPSRDEFRMCRFLGAPRISIPSGASSPRANSQSPQPPRRDDVTSTYSRWRQTSGAGAIRASQQGGLFEKCSQNLSRLLLSEQRRVFFDHPTLTDVTYFH